MRVLVIIFAMFWTLVRSQDTPMNNFNNPAPYFGYGSDDNPNNNAYTMGSVVNLRWTTNWTQVMMGLKQVGVSGVSVFYTIVSGVPPTNYNWVVDLYNKDLADGNVFYLIMYDMYDPTNSTTFLSRNFNLTYGTVTSPRSSSTSSSFTLSVTPTAQSVTQASTPTTTSSSSPSETVLPTISSNNIATKVGAGVGVGVGVFALLIGLGIGWFIFRRRNKVASDSEPLRQQDSQDQKYAPSKTLSPYTSPGTEEDTHRSRLSFSNPPNYNNEPLELHHDRPPVELPP